jgi:hypothetical protein
MPAPLLRFADVEAALVGALGNVSGVRRVVTLLPAALVGVLPLLRVQRFGGHDNRVTDTANVDIETLAGTYGQASALANLVHTTVLALAHTPLQGTMFDTVETISHPIWVDYENPNVSRFVATYEIAARVLA